MNKNAMLAVVFAAGCLGSAPKTTTSTDPTTPNTPSDPGSNSSNPSNPSSAASNCSGGQPGRRPTPRWAWRRATPRVGPTTRSTTTTPRPTRSRCCSEFRTRGPPEISTRMHSCQKMKYATVGNVLTTLGVNMASTAKTAHAADRGSALQGRRAGRWAQANYGARVREASRRRHHGGGHPGYKLFDIMVQAAPEIIAAMPTSRRAA